MRKIRSKTCWATAAAAALFWSAGCRTDRDGDRAPSADELALQAQRESERAFGKAKEAQEEAREEQHEATIAERKATEAREEAMEAEQRAQLEHQEALTAQQQAQLQGEAAQEEARTAQERALQAQQQAQQRYPARPTEPTAPAQPGEPGEPVEPEPGVEHDPWAAPTEPAPTETATATATSDDEPWFTPWIVAAEDLAGGTIATGTATAEGVVETASGDELVLRRAVGEDLEIKVDAERTTITQDGNPVPIDGIPHGASVRVSYRTERGQAVADRIEVKDRGPAAPVSPRS